MSSTQLLTADVQAVSRALLRAMRSIYTEAATLPVLFAVVSPSWQHAGATFTLEYRFLQTEGGPLTGIPAVVRNLGGCAGAGRGYCRLMPVPAASSGSDAGDREAANAQRAAEEAAAAMERLCEVRVAALQEAAADLREDLVALSRLRQHIDALQSQIT
jgi:hypothetical protein